MNLTTIAPLVITLSWAALVITWAVTSFTVKRDINRSAWWRFWWVRIIILAVVAGFVWHATLAGRFHYQAGFFNPATANVPLIAVGLILCVLGILLAIWARLHLGRNWSPAPNLKEGHELVTSGPYRLVRHPIYTGIIMAMLGTALITPIWFIIFIIFSIMFVWRVRVEENLMIQQFPNQYPEYKKKTWALVPYVW
jgi:protein-S-isoprenylcysteine O-methyltransferase Ste14